MNAVFFKDSRPDLVGLVSSHFRHIRSAHRFEGMGNSTLPTPGGQKT